MEMKCKACRLYSACVSLSPSPSSPIYLCMCVCVRHSWLESRCADCQSVESGRTYCQQLLSSADSSIYEYICVYVCVRTHREGDRDTQRERDSDRDRDMQMEALRVVFIESLNSFVINILKVRSDPAN